MTFGASRQGLNLANYTASSMTGSGGTVTNYVDTGTLYYVHSFTTTGSSSFVVSNVVGTPTVDALIVGGGGAGGGATTTIGAGGGGAAGEVKPITGQSVTAQTYTITVGVGGTQASGANGGNGGSSSAFGITSAGGAGGTVNSAASNGGGSGSNSTTSWTSTAGTYAYKGGNAFGSATAANIAGGGGADYTAAGTDAASGVGGAGAPNTASAITGTTAYYGGGGGGGGTTAGQTYSPINGTLSSTSTYGAGATNGNGGSPALGYGHGGGGARNSATTARSGGSGYQGVVIVRYPGTPVSSLSYVNSATTTTTSVTWPTVSAGDVAICYNIARSSTSTAPSTSTPSGFTNLLSGTNDGTSPAVREIVSYKICTGSEGGTSLTGLMTGSGTPAQQGILVIYRGNQAAKVVQLNGFVGGTPSNAAPSNQTLALGSYAGPYIGFSLYASSGSVTTRGSTVAETRELNESTTFYLKLFEATSSSVSFSNSTISMADYGNGNILHGGIIQIY